MEDSPAQMLEAIKSTVGNRHHLEMLVKQTSGGKLARIRLNKTIFSGSMISRQFNSIKADDFFNSYEIIGVS